ncbi:MAG: prolyl oligopeptidase family serine peptidase [Spirochaetes bacterium]|nr:prolyl oligopeptidase family serine peptidase [Spirochaetota bacterium]
MKNNFPARIVIIGIAAATMLFPQDAALQTSQNNDKLKKAFEQHPDADADGDGILTMKEAEAYRSTMKTKGTKGGKDAAQTPTNVPAATSDGEGNGTDDAAVLALFEAREFKGVKYRLLRPIDLPNNPDKKYPMLLSLHGAAGVGDDNVKNVREWGTIYGEEAWRRKHPCFVVVPQSPGMWQTPGTTTNLTKEVRAKLPKVWQDFLGGKESKRLENPELANLDRVFLLLDALAKEFPIDTDRVYVQGHSMGGFGTWTAVVEQPNRFAAAIASAGWIGPWADVAPIKDLPMWAFQGGKDKEIQVQLGNTTFEWMKQLGHNLKFTEVANMGHSVVHAALSYTGDSPGRVTKYASDKCDKTADVWEWLFSKKRAAK